MKRRNKIIVSSVLSIAMCASLIAGSTFALFSSESTTNIAITAGKVDLTAKITGLKTYSYVETAEGSNEYASAEMPDGEFIYGTATLSDDAHSLELNDIVPGDKAELTITLENKSTIAVKYQVVVTVKSDEGLYKALDVGYAGEEFVNSELSSTKLSNWKELGVTDDSIAPLEVTVELPYDYADNGTGETVQGKTCELEIAVQAVQANAHTTDPVPVDPADPATQNIVPVYTFEELKTFRDEVNGGASYVGKTVKLYENIDLNNEEWTPIGVSTNQFAGTFDGQGHTISNLMIPDPAEDEYVGFFRGTTGSTVIENLELHNASVTSLSDGATPYFSSAAALIGNAYCATVTNVKLTGLVKIEADYFAGGIAGYTYVPNFSNIEVSVDEGSYVKANFEDAGGVIAFIGENGLTQVTDMKSNIDVMAKHGAGGIIGAAIACTKPEEFSKLTATGTVSLIQDGSVEEWEKCSLGGICGSYLLSGGETKTFIDVHFNGILDNPYGEEHIIKSNGSSYGLVGGRWGVDEGANDGLKLINSSIDRKVSDGLTLHAAWNNKGALDDNFSYYISTAAGLVEWAKTLEEKKTAAQYVELQSDIDLNGIDWVAPSGNPQFYGNGHTISNVYCVPKAGAPSYWRAGLFGKFSGEVHDLVLKNVTARAAQAGALMGHTDGCTLHGVTISGKIDISCDKGYTKENSYGVGLFIGAVGGNESASTDLTVAADCKATLDLSGMTGVLADQTAATRFFSYTVYSIDVADLPAANVITVEEGAQIVASESIVDGLALTYKNGASRKVYAVSSADGWVELANIRKSIKTGEGVKFYISLEHDIDLADAKEEYVPMSGYWVELAGNGHVIENVNAESVTDGTTCRGGLFTEGGGGVISDLTLRGVTVSGSQAGAFYGHSEGGTLINCRLEGEVTVTYEKSGEDYPGIGVFVGINAAGTTFDRVTLDKNAKVVLDFGGNFEASSDSSVVDFLVGYKSAESIIITDLPVNEGASIEIKGLKDLNVSGDSTIPDHKDYGMNVDPGADLIIDGELDGGEQMLIKLDHTAFNYFLGNEGITEGKIVIRNVHFKGTGTQAGYAMTLGFNANVDVTFENCTFENMYCAIYCNANATGNSHITIRNCNYINTKWGYGLSDPTNAGKTITVTFVGNSGIDGDGMEQL